MCGRTHLLLVLAVAGCADQTFVDDGLGYSKDAREHDVRGADAGGGEDRSDVPAGDAPDGGLGPDAESADDGTRPELPPRVRGGGWAGARIDGRLLVVATVVGRPLGGARVVVETGTGTISARTDLDGAVWMVDPALRGPVVVHVFAAGQGYVSFVGIQSEQLWVEYEEAGPKAPVKVRGRVIGRELLPDWNWNTIRYGYVEAIAESVFSAPADQDQGEFRSNEVVQGALWDDFDYSLNADASAFRGIWAAAGLFNFDTGATSWTAFGCVAGLSFMDGLVAPDLVLRPLHSDPLRVVVLHRPPESSSVVFATLNFPNRGGVVLLPQVLGDAGAFLRPRLEVEAATATYGGGAQFLGPGRNRISIKQGVSTSSVVLDDFLPLPRLSSSGRSLSVQTSSAVSLSTLTIKTGTTTHWQVIMLEGILSTRLPVPPSEFSDPLRGSMSVQTETFRLEDFSSEAYSLSTITPDLRLYSMAISTVTF